MDYQKVASSVLEFIGGKENIAHLEHCSTRLRFSLIDSSKTQTDKLKLVPGVLNVIEGKQQYQVVIGNEVVEVYDELEKLVGTTTGEKAKSNFEWKNLGSYLLDFLVGVFQPLVPAMAGGGMVKALVALATTFGWLDKSSQTVTILNQIGDAPLYFLPILVAFTTAKKLKVNELVAVSIVATTLLPNITKLITDGATLFGFGIQKIQYSYQVFAAILIVIAYSYIFKIVTKYSPKPIRIFFVPMVSMLITVPLGLLILGPLGYNVGVLLTSVILGIYTNVGWITVGLLAAILPFMVSTGMHKAMLPYATSTMGQLGKEVLYMPASLAHNIAESGATFAVALKSKDVTKRSAALSAGISAFCGITEPALYGVTLLNKKVLISVVLGALTSGLYLGWALVEAIVLIGPGFPSMAMFLSDTLPKNFMHACIGFGISFVVSFILAFVLYKDEEKEEVADKVEEKEVFVNEVKEELKSPSTGEVVALENVKDAVFSSKVMGEGFGILSTSGKLVAPANGTIEMVYQTKHAIGFKTDLGTEILFHIGIDTVQLNGKYFNVHIENGQAVNEGDVLVTFDKEKIQQEGYDSTIIVIVTNKKGNEIELLKTGAVTLEDSVLRV